MFEHDFYPTPNGLIRKMLEPYDRESLSDKVILEPSAGKGDIADFIIDTLERSYKRREYLARNIHCCEIDHDLRGVLSSKGYRLVCEDFMGYSGVGVLYDLIVMNPPFSHGVEHVLHAWDILRAGDLVAILPKEVINNPYCESRKLLVKVIQDNHGVVEDAGKAFEDAERKTSVEVCIIRLTKEEYAGIDDLFTDSRFSRAKIDDSAPDSVENMLAKRDVIASMEDAYHSTLASFKTAYKALYELSMCGSVFGNRMLGSLNEGRHGSVKEAFCRLMGSAKLTSISTKKEFQEVFKESFNEFSVDLRRAAWEKVFDTTQMDRFMTESVKNEFRKLQQDQHSIEFNQENVIKLLDTLFLNTNKIGEAAILEAFDLMTKYHKENRIHIEGWKTNDFWRVNRKIILPYVVDWSIGRPHCSWSVTQKLDDIDRGLCFLTGKSFDSIKRISISVDAACRELCLTGNSEFFDFRVFKKGTGHFTFKDTDTWESFNIAACKGKNWLPGTNA